MKCRDCRGPRDRQSERVRPDICKSCWEGRQAFVARMSNGGVTAQELAKKQKSRDWDTPPQGSAD